MFKFNLQSFFGLLKATNMIFFVSLFLIFFDGGLILFAQSDLVPSQNDICGDSCPIGNPSEVSSFDRQRIVELIVSLARFLTYIIPAIGVLMIVWAGLLIISDGGDGNRASRGKSIIFTVIIGIVVAISAYFVVAFFGNTLSGNLLETLNAGNSSSTR